MQTRNDFATLIRHLADYFTTETAAVSVTTVAYGTLTRAEVFRLAARLTEVGR